VAAPVKRADDDEIRMAEVAPAKILLFWPPGGFTAPGEINQSFFCFFFVHKKEDLTLQERNIA